MLVLFFQIDNNNLEIFNFSKYILGLELRKIVIINIEKKNDSNI